MCFWNFEVYSARENESESGVSSNGMAGGHVGYAVTNFLSLPSKVGSIAPR